MIAARRGRQRGLALLVGMVVCLLGAGCASIPSSTRPQVISESVPASAPAEDDEDLRYDEIVPQPGERPEDLVRNYLRVGGSYERGHARARAYLTEAGNKDWDDRTGVTILEDLPYLNVQGGGTTVQMTARQRGRIEPDGSYRPDRAPFPHTFRLKKVNGNWRIDNPPDGVLVEAGTFDVAYQPFDVYFLDSTRTRVVPDERWFAAPGDSLPSLLVTAIEQGPSAWLKGAVRSDLEGVTLQNNVERGSDRVKVYLSGLGERTDTLPPGGFAQLVWTLNQLGVGGVEVYADGRLIAPGEAPQRSLQRFSDWRGFDPDALPVSTPGYFVRDGAVWNTNDVAVPGPAGRGDYRATAVAVSMNERSMAVVRRTPAGGVTLFVGPVRALRPSVSGSSLTPPTWGSAADEVWTVKDGEEVVLVPVHGGATRVVAALSRIGPVRALRLSRDGTRVALVAGPAGRERLHVGVVIRDNGAVRVEGLRELDVGESPVSDASWSDALTLVALVRAGQQDSGLYTVGVGGVTSGRLVVTLGLPGPPAAVAAAPQLPLLTLAAGAVWRTPATDERWTRVTRRAGAESAPVYPG